MADSMANKLVTKYDPRFIAQGRLFREPIYLRKLLDNIRGEFLPAGQSDNSSYALDMPKDYDFGSNTGHIHISNTLSEEEKSRVINHELIHALQERFKPPLQSNKGISTDEFLPRVLGHGLDSFSNISPEEKLALINSTKQKLNKQPINPFIIALRRMGLLD